MMQYVPGDSLEALRERSGVADLIKLNANENPIGSSPRALEALRTFADLNVYGDDTNAELRALIASRLEVSAEHIVLGHGSNELIALACAAFLKPGDCALMFAPSFSLFRTSVRMQGAQAVEIAFRGGQYDIDGLLENITSETKMVLLCDPNNPTGTAMDAAQWSRLLAGVPPTIVLLIDQAYVEYMDRPFFDGPALLRSRPRTLILRTLSKIYGLAALRFGYAYGDPEVIAAINARRTPYNVSSPAKAAARAAFEDEAFVARSAAANADGRRLLTSGLRSMGLDVIESHANFVSAGVPVNADRACEELLQRGIAVRSGDALTMPGRVRITVGTAAQNRAVLEAFRDLLREWSA